MNDYDDNRCQGCGESQAQGYKCGACGARLCRECDARYGFCAACHHESEEPAPAGDCKHEQITYAAGGYFCDRCGEMVTVDAPAGDALAGEALAELKALVEYLDNLPKELATLLGVKMMVDGYRMNNARSVLQRARKLQEADDATDDN